MSADSLESKLAIFQTLEGQAWLSQFEEMDISIAELVLSSIIYVSADTLHRAIRTLLNEFVSECKGDSIAMFAVREVDEEADRLQLPLWRNKPSYFNLDNQEARPAAVRAGKDVGSEGEMAGLVRDLCRELGTRALDHPSIATMRSHRCRHAIFLDDIFGSGNRAHDFALAFYNNPWVRSWRSFNYLKTHAVAFGATNVALRTLESTNSLDSVLFYRRVAVGRDEWTASQKAAVFDLCRRYSPRTSRKKMPLGFGEQCTLIVFAHKCPNNAPAILWAPNNGVWRPLFSGRPVFCEAVAKSLRTDLEQQQEKLDQLLKQRGRASSSSSILDASGRARLLILALCRRRRKRERLSDIAEMPEQEIQAVLIELQVLGWLDNRNRVTEAGVRELEHARHLQSENKLRPQLKGDPYYPKSLRGA